MKPVFERRFYRKPERFVAELRPHRWERDKWIFRGHADARWDLLPAAFREDIWEAGKPWGVFAPYSPTTLLDADRSKHEAFLLHRFGNMLNEAGHPMPESAYDFLDRAPAPMAVDWIRELRSLAALAQHHGVPTRLLDFTERGLVAAHFAAQALEAPPPGERAASHLCVWALKKEFLDLGEKAVNAWFGLLRAPRASNANMHAQAGCFVTWAFDEPLTLRKLVVHVLLENIALHDGVARPKAPILVKLSIHRKHAPKIRDLLRAEGINSMSLFPGVDGIVRHLRDHPRD